MTHVDELQHISLCARAFRKDQLSESFLEPPSTLAGFVRGLGANASWLLATP